MCKALCADETIWCTGNADARAYASVDGGCVNPQNAWIFTAPAYEHHVYLPGSGICAGANQGRLPGCPLPHHRRCALSAVKPEALPLSAVWYTSRIAHEQNGVLCMTNSNKDPNKQAPRVTRAMRDISNAWKSRLGAHLHDTHREAHAAGGVVVTSGSHLRLHHYLVSMHALHDSGRRIMHQTQIHTYIVYILLIRRWTLTGVISCVSCTATCKS